ncbi:hypothetical protein PLICRDRAFT_150178 [Plicaturopsis crispa FD-325 SS-3]|nr:hypothetical protein PLICRDRAFT_150178 [Plicaturopsis crispa FD-325 SS-3]
MGSSLSHPSSPLALVARYTTAPLAYLFYTRREGQENPNLIRSDVAQADLELQSLRHDLDERNERVIAITEESRVAREDGKTKERLLREKDQEVLMLRRQAEEYRVSLERLRASEASLNAHLQRQEKQRKVLEDELRHLKTEYADTAGLLDARTSELKSAQAFLTKADTISGADVIRMVEALNAEILQNAAFMADSFEFGLLAEEEAEEAAVEEAAQNAQRFMGPALIQLLRTGQHDDPMIVQIAFQACLAEFARWIATAWCFEDSQDDHFLEIHEQMLRREPHAVAGRWRALTRMYVRSGLEEPDALPHLIALIRDSFLDILEIAGSSGGFLGDVPEALVTSFRDGVSTIIDLSLRLNKTIGQDLTSCDMETIAVKSDEAFDSEFMTDAFDGGNPRENLATGRVLCTTDLGLQRVEKVSKGDIEVMERTTLLKPRVALDSVVSSLGEP